MLQEDFPQPFLNFLFGLSESQTVKQLKKNVAILKENQNFQQSVLDTHATPHNITIHLANNRHMINGLVNALKV